MENGQKNIKFLNEITAFSNAAKEPMTIHVYGDGPDRGLILNNPNVVWHGTFSNRDVNKVFANVKILLLPSNMEGFGYVIVEAFANKTPCVVADTFANASYLVDETRGALMGGFDAKRWFEAIKRLDGLPQDAFTEIADACETFWRRNLTFGVFARKWIELVG